VEDDENIASYQLWLWFPFLPVFYMSNCPGLVLAPKSQHVYFGSGWDVLGLVSHGWDVLGLVSHGSPRLDLL
jgi:hypothetical protein